MAHWRHTQEVCATLSQFAIQWHHPNEEWRKYHRANIDYHVALEAQAKGHDSWLVFGPDEELLAQGVLTDTQDELKEKE